MVIGSNVESLERFEDTVEGDTPSLCELSGFDQLIDIVPRPVHFLLYANLGGIAEVIEDSLDDYGLDEYRQEIRPFVEPLDHFLSPHR